MSATMQANRVPESSTRSGPEAAARIPLWVDLRHVAINKRLPFFTAIRQAGVERVVFAKGDDHLGREGLATYALDGKGRLLEGKKTVGRLMVVQDAKQQAKAGAQEGIVIVEESKLRILPIENLIASRQDRPGTLFARASSPQEADLCATILQRGVHGILLVPAAANDVVTADALLRARGRPGHALPTVPADMSTNGMPGQQPKEAEPTPPDIAVVRQPLSQFGFQQVKVTAVSDAGPGDRVCVDTTSILEEGEGLLVGSCAHSLALVLAETAMNPVVNPRPFRINAGAVHSYCLVPGGKTAYLSELAAGSPVVVAGPRGTRDVTVGRVKVENRPHRIVHWQTPRGPASIALQLAETVRLAGVPQAIPVTAIQPGITILVHSLAAAARHTGIPVDASVEER